MRWPVMLLALLTVMPLSAPAEQKPSSPPTSSATCTFADGNQITVRYPNLPAQKEGLRRGELWPPSTSPMYLFTTAAVSTGTTAVPPGAYSLYVVPDKEKWTLVINKGVTSNAPYDHAQDVTRQPMEIGQLDQPQELDVAFAQIGDKQCNMRVYYAKTGAWAEFKEK